MTDLAESQELLERAMKLAVIEGADADEIDELLDKAASKAKRMRAVEEGGW